ncbi:MAG: hypothetical protein R2788_02945 [Saprospiraceae bacterium]
MGKVIHNFNSLMISGLCEKIGNGKEGRQFKKLPTFLLLKFRSRRLCDAAVKTAGEKYFLTHDLSRGLIIKRLLLKPF